MNKILSVPSFEPLQASHTAGAEMQFALAVDAAPVLLELNGFGVRFGSNAVLHDLSFTVPEKGAVLLVGPKGVERTTLLRTLAGYGAESVSYQTSGTAHYHGKPLGAEVCPAIVAQNAQLMMASVLENIVVNLPERNQLTRPAQRERALNLLSQAGLEALCDRLDETMVSLPLALQRHLSILREIVADPLLLCIDEPTAGLTDVEAARLIAYLRVESQKRALLIAMHNQVHARLLGGHAIFIAYGRMLEQQPIPQIFETPSTAAAQEFAQTGKCSIASFEASLSSQVSANNILTDSGEIQPLQEPVADEPVTDESVELKPAAEVGKFMWLKRGMLAGTPAPGRLGTVDHDLQALREHGVTVLMTLTENDIDEAKLRAFGLKRVWEPVPESGAPDMVQGIRICKTLESLLKQGEVIAIQGECGLGRTGTILAAHLLWKGIQLDDALEYLRRVEPRWVQTQSQLDFLSEFAQRV